MTGLEDTIVSESVLYDETDVNVREPTESGQAEEKHPHRLIPRVLKRLFSIELVAFLCSFSSGLHTVIRLSVQQNSWLLRLTIVAQDKPHHREDVSGQPQLYGGNLRRYRAPLGGE